MRARYVHAVTPADVGRRVSVRMRLRDDPDHATTDLLGTLLDYADGVLEVDARQGRTRVPEADVLASRVVPEPPPRRPRSAG